MTCYRERTSYNNPCFCDWLNHTLGLLCLPLFPWLLWTLDCDWFQTLFCLGCMVTCFPWSSAWILWRTELRYLHPTVKHLNYKIKEYVVDLNSIWIFNSLYTCFGHNVHHQLHQISEYFKEAIFVTSGFNVRIKSHSGFTWFPCVCLWANAEMVPKTTSCHCMLLMQPSQRKFSNKPMSYFVYLSNNHCHRVTTQLQLINIIIIII